MEEAGVEIAIIKIFSKMHCKANLMQVKGHEKEIGINR